jgi:hypothetical protein
MPMRAGGRQAEGLMMLTPTDIDSNLSFERSSQGSIRPSHSHFNGEIDRSRPFADFCARPSARLDADL